MYVNIITEHGYTSKPVKVFHRRQLRWRRWKVKDKYLMRKMRSIFRGKATGSTREEAYLLK